MVTSDVISQLQKTAGSEVKGVLGHVITSAYILVMVLVLSKIQIAMYGQSLATKQHIYTPSHSGSLCI